MIDAKRMRLAIEDKALWTREELQGLITFLQEERGLQAPRPLHPGEHADPPSVRDGEISGE